MSQVDMDRIRDDLETMKKAAGVELPFGWEDVWWNIAISIGCVIAVVWMIVPHHLSHRWGWIPALTLSVVYVVYFRVKYRRSTGRSPLRRREYTAGLLLALMIVPVVIVYRYWGASLGISLLHLRSIFSFFLGFALLVPALLDRSRISWLGLAIPIIVCGLCTPYFEIPARIQMGIAVAIALMLMSAIQVWQLRAQNERVVHGAD